MKNCGELIEKTLNAKRVKRRDFCEFIGMTPQNLTKMLRKSSLDAELLENCCRYLGLDPASFFDFRPSSEGGVSVGSIEQNVGVGDAQVNFRDGMFEKLLAEKDARIESLERTVGLLLSKLPGPAFVVGSAGSESMDK